MFERLRDSYLHNSDGAYKWAYFAIRDIGKYKDPLTPLDSITNAYKYLGKAAQTAAIIAKEYSNNEFYRDMLALQATVDNAYEQVRTNLNMQNKRD